MKKVKFIAIMIAVCITQIICGVLVFADTEPADMQVYSDTDSNQSEKSENGLPQIEYASGSAGTFFTFGQPTDGKLIVAQYDDNNVLSALKTYDVTNASELQIPNKDAEGFNGKIKCMLWSNFQEFKPKANPLEKQFRSITLSAEDIDDSKTDVYAGVLYFYPAGETRGSVKYEIDENTIYYVNGVYMGVLDSSAVNEFIVNDKNAAVTLQKESAADSAGLPSKYNKVMISKHVTAVVDQVVDSTEDSKILFKDMSEGISTYIKVYKNDDTYRYSFTLNGEEIDPSELKENDVLTIYNDPNQDLADSGFYEVQVSRTTVNGRYTGCNSTRDEFTISAVKYEVANGLISADNFEILTEYTLYLDTFGRIAYADEISNPKKLGILKNVYRKNNGDWIAEVITKEGKAQDFVFREKDASAYSSLIDNDAQRTESYPKQVISYSTNSSGEITINEVLEGTGEIAGEYSASAKQIGPLEFSEAATIIDISNVDSVKDSYSAVTTDRLIDNGEYTVYGYDKSAMNDMYRFILITAGNVVPVEEKYTEGIGILTSVYQKSNGDWVADIIASDGTDKEFILDEEQSEKYKELLSNDSTRTEAYPKQIVKYKVNSSDEFTIEEVLTGTLINGTYNKSSSAIGSIQIDDTTEIINISNVNHDRYDHISISLDRLVDGEEYTLYSYRNLDVDSTYDVILITAGNVIEEYIEGIGILTSVYQKSNGDWIADVITKNAEIKEFRLDNSDGEDYHALLSESYRKTDAYPQQVIRYKATAYGKMIIKTVDNNGKAAVEMPVYSGDGSYNPNTNKIGSIKISDATTIIDISNVDYKKDGYHIISQDNLRDGAMYTVYGYEKSDEDGSCGFVIITRGVGGPYSASQLAIFLEAGIDLDEYDNVVDTMTLYYDNEKITYVVDEDSMVDVMDYREGDLLIFSLNYSGKINEAYPVFNYSGLLNSSTYEDFKNIFYNGDILSSNDWSALLSDGKEDVDIQFGVIVKLGSVYALAEEIRYDDNGYYIDLSQAKEIVISPDTKIYTYNFANSPRNWGRIVLNDDMHYTPDIKDAYENGDMSSDKYYISHEDVEDNVVLAVIRTFNDDEVQEIYQMINE